MYVSVMAEITLRDQIRRVTRCRLVMGGMVREAWEEGGEKDEPSNGRQKNIEGGRGGGGGKRNISMVD